MPRLHWLKALVLGLVVGLVGAIFGLSPPGIAFEETLGLSWLFLLRGPIAPPANVAVVALDKRSAANLGLPAEPQRWPRSVQARIIRAIDRAGASTIAVDLIFSEHTRPAEDAALATAIAEAGRVILFKQLERRQGPLLGDGAGSSGEIRLEQITEPIPELAQAAAAVAPFPLPKVGASVRQFWSFQSAAGEGPTMPAVALEIHALEPFYRWINAMEGDGLLEVGRMPFLMSGLHGRLSEMMQTARDAYRSIADADRLLTAGKASPVVNALASLYVGANSHYLNFYGPPGTVPVIPSAALLSPERGEAVDLAGKAVFLGAAEVDDPDQPDGFYSVFTWNNGVDLSGVEIAATAFANMLTRRMIEPASGVMTAALLGAVGVALGLSATLLPAVVVVPSVIAAAAIYTLAAQAVFNGFNLWLPLATPLLLQVPLALFLGILAQYVLAHRQRQTMSQAISYYLPEKVAEGLLDGGAIGPGEFGETVYATCLASDLENFTAIAETMSPQAVARYLNAYFAAIAEPIKRHGADVLEFRADGMMCAWTNTAPRDSVHISACEAALDVFAAVRQFDGSERGHNLPTRLGIHAGWIFVGHAGGGGRYAYSIIGDIANTASRIEGLNKVIGTSLLVSEMVAAPFSDEFLLRPVGRFRLRGKIDPIGIVEVICRRQEASATALALCARFAAALAAFEAGRWDQAAAAFADIARSHPADGPSNFYRSRSLALFQEGSPDGDPTIIRVDAK